MESLKSVRGDKSAGGKSKSWVGRNVTGPFVDDVCDVARDTLGPLSVAINWPLRISHRVIEGVTGAVGRAVMNVVPGIKKS